MALFTKITHKAGSYLMAVGAFFLLIIMTMTVLNILYRLFWGRVILGNYELTEMMIVITAGFSMAYAVMHKSNVVVKIITSKLSDKAVKIVNALMSLAGIGVWGIISYATVWLMWRKGFDEGQTELLDIPYLPLKWVWACALILITLLFLTDFLKSVLKDEKK